MKIFTKDVILEDLRDTSIKSVLLVDLLKESKELLALLDGNEFVELRPEKGVFTLGSVEDKSPPTIVGMNRDEYIPHVPYKMPNNHSLVTNEQDMLCYTLAAVLAETLSSEFCVDVNSVPNPGRFIKFNEDMDKLSRLDFMTEVVRLVGVAETDVVQTLEEWGLYDLSYQYGQLMIIKRGNALANLLGKILTEQQADREDALAKGELTIDDLTEEEKKLFL